MPNENMSHGIILTVVMYLGSYQIGHVLPCFYLRETLVKIQNFQNPDLICRIQHFEVDFLWKVSLKILNSGIILRTFTHGESINNHHLRSLQ